MIAFLPGEEWSYFPSITELVITAGWISLGVLAYVYIVKRFAILSGPAAGERVA